jgi:predicted esterase
MQKPPYIHLLSSVVFSALFTVMSPAQSQNDGKPADVTAPALPGLPEAPFKLKTPAAPPAKIQKVDLKTEDPDSLLEYMSMAEEDENVADAYAFLFWANQRKPHPGGMQSLARFSAALGKVDDAFYWLQRAALEDQYDGDEVKSHAAFKPLRSDERYGKLCKFTEAAKTAWGMTGYHREDVTLPAGTKPGATLPVIVALHGLGSVPEDFGGLQDLADELGAAVVSVSATIPWGKNSFSCAEEFEKDWTHISKSLAAVKDRVIPQSGKCIAAGFSQGGQLAAELAAAHPEFFAGAIILSPGYRGTKRLGEAIKTAAGKQSGQLYFVIWQNREHPDTIAAAKDDAKLLTTAGARVISHAFKGDRHTFPPGAEDHLAIWSKLIMEAKP